MILQELPQSTSTRETLKFIMAAIITRGNILFGIPPTFSLSYNLRICLYSSSVEVYPSFLFMAINLVIFLFIIPLERFFSLRISLVMYWRLPSWFFFFFNHVILLPFDYKDCFNSLLEGLYCCGWISSSLVNLLVFPDLSYSLGCIQSIAPS